MFTITDPAGKTKEVRIKKFPAMDGWELQRDFLHFAASKDKAFRRAYTLEVLKYATVVNGNVELPLTTDALIDNHLCSWENVKLVFERVLTDNGIDPNTHALQTHFWADAGAEMAVAFIAETSRLLGPAFGVLGENLVKE